MFGLKKITAEDDLAYVMNAVSTIRRELNGSVPLIGFSGSPWTLATYMVEGGSSKDFARVKAMAYDQPQLMHQLLSLLPGNMPPMLVTQHIPAVFSRSFANRLNGALPLEIKEAEHGDKIEQGHVYIAPGDQHLTLARKGSELILHLRDDGLAEIVDEACDHRVFDDVDVLAQLGIELEPELSLVVERDLDHLPDRVEAAPVVLDARRDPQDRGDREG